ncbi:MAG: hypothetical protein K2X38_02040 [Gemmataceae bacterium]|nr:hypothetical protein [Gemmataceae bacterium]
MSVKVHVQGPGRYTVKDIEQKTPDGTRIIGNSVKEVTIIPTGVGTIEVTITTKAPNDDAVRTQKLKIEAK